MPRRHPQCLVVILGLDPTTGTHPNRAKGPRLAIWFGSVSRGSSFARGRLSVGHAGARDIGVRPDLGHIQESKDSNTEETGRTTAFTEKKAMTLRAKRRNSCLLRERRGPPCFLRVRTLASCPPNASREEVCILQGTT
jgi:hypothetical protein